MKVADRGGHSPNCTGANGIIKEQPSVREVVSRLNVVLKEYGHTIIDCNSNASTVSGELNEGTKKANANNADIYIPFHMNASNGNGHGVECLVYNSSSKKAIEIGTRMCANLATLGLQNRGIKYRPELHDLKQTTMQAVIVELLFCDNKHDVDIWNKTSWDTLVYLIANAIDPNIPKEKPISQPIPPTQGQQTFYRVVAGSYSNRTNAEKQKALLESKGITGVFLEAIKK
ncbi:MAG: N-acetylmuramoyl-L-alanine amidase [Clostridium sp.]